jgi:2'-5' RNA ligase
MIRSFIAIEVPNNIREEIAKVIDDLKQSDYPVRWVTKENLHLTLIFLGEVKEDFLDKVIGQLKVVANKAKSFEMNLQGLGAFPSQRSPRVIWIGTKIGEPEIINLQSKIETVLVTIGYKPEVRKFHSHLTIGRVKGVIKDPAKIFEYNYTSRSFPVKSIVLFKSTLRPEGPIYEKLQEFNFG